MALEHLLVFGWVEAIATGLVVAYLQRTAPEMLPYAVSPETRPGRRAVVKRLAIGLGVLVLLSPLGLYLPRRFHAGSAWGEWSRVEIRAEIAKVTGGRGYLPAGMKRAEESGWKAPLPDYALPGQKSAFLGYILSGAIGGLGLILLTLATRRAWARKDESGTAGLDAKPNQT
jgi:hypothetical protein